MAEIIDIAADTVDRLLQQDRGNMGGGNQNFDVWDNILNPLNGTPGGEQVHGASDVEVGVVVTSLGVNTFIFCACILLYEVVFRYIPSVYACKRNQQDLNINMKSPLPLAWVPSVLRVTWSQVLRTCGMDAYFFLRYIQLCGQVTAVSGLWAIVILWPVYAAGGNDAHGWYHLSMANLVDNSWRLWFPTIFMVIMTFYLIFLMNVEYKHYVELRMEYLAKGNNQVHPQQRYSLIVEEIPNELRSDQALREYFERMFPRKVHSAKIVLKLPVLDALYERRNHVLRRLEKCQAIQKIAGRRPFHRVAGGTVLSKNAHFFENDPSLPQKGERTDSINYYTKYLEILNEKVAKAQSQKLALAREGDGSNKSASEWISSSLGLGKDGLGAARNSNLEEEEASTNMTIGGSILMVLRTFGFDFLFGGFTPNLDRNINAVVDSMSSRAPSSTGFVTFTDLVTVTCAVRAPLSHEAGVLTVQMAPEPQDVQWSNAHINTTWKKGRVGTANALLSLGAILWSVPVTLVQAFANLNSLASITGLTWLEGIAASKWGSFLNGYIPVLALIALIAALPYIFSGVGLKYERRKTQSDIQHSMLERFFLYQLANIFVTVTAGSILDSLAGILDHPSNAFAILGESVPTVVGYFVMFVLTKLLAGLPVILLRVVPLGNRILSAILCRSKISTQRELDDEYKLDALDLGQEYPNQLLVVIIMFTYAAIAPIILPVGAFYFLCAFVVYKKQSLLVFSSTSESGGVFFPTACHRTLVGLVAAQATLIGYTVLRRGIYQPLVLLFLPFYTITMMSTFKQLYEDPGQYLSLERAIELDKKTPDATHMFETNVYRQPVLITENLEPLPFRRSEPNETSTSESTAEKVV